MRPKKKILYVSSSEDEMSMTRFSLEVNGLKVIWADEAAGTHLASEVIDLVLIDKPLTESVKLVADYKMIVGHIPMVILGDLRKSATVAHVADAFFDKKTLTVAELLQRIRVMAQRKRGPRKGVTYHKPVSEAVEMRA